LRVFCLFQARGFHRGWGAAVVTPSLGRRDFRRKY
jgi:hypothetical protein